MIKTITFVRAQPGLDRESFFERWCEHTREWDLRDHPDISNRMIMLEEGSEYVGINENHWPNRQALEDAVKWYETEEGMAHMEDLMSFMDAENSPTHVISHEVDISVEKGIEWLTRPESTL